MDNCALSPLGMAISRADRYISKKSMQLDSFTSMISNPMLQVDCMEMAMELRFYSVGRDSGYMKAALADSKQNLLRKSYKLNGYRMNESDMAYALDALEVACNIGLARTIRQRLVSRDYLSH